MPHSPSQKAGTPYHFFAITFLRCYTNSCLQGNSCAVDIVPASSEIFIINLQVLKDLCWVIFLGLYLEAGWSDYQDIF